eukprot:1188239-Prorocentrum_minimum.AAC.4
MQAQVGNVDIVFDNFSDREATVMTLATKNRAGLLFDIMKSLKDVGIRFGFCKFLPRAVSRNPRRVAERTTDERIFESRAPSRLCPASPSTIRVRPLSLALSR